MFQRVFSRVFRKWINTTLSEDREVQRRWLINGVYKDSLILSRSSLDLEMDALKQWCLEQGEFTVGCAVLILQRAKREGHESLALAALMDLGDQIEHETQQEILT